MASDDEVIDLGRGVVLRTVWTPGHASHHLSYEWEGNGAFFTGDAVGLFHPNFPILIPTTPPTSFNLEKMLQSLFFFIYSSTMEIYTPHYGVVQNAIKWIDENVKSVLIWRTIIEGMKKSGLTNERMTRAIIEEICKRIGRPAGEMPGYLCVSVKISVLGFLRYLNGEGSEAWK
jgi:glyoxylase-like metal-dependent hydrolase (beta-lactamase superfamily II)